MSSGISIKLFDRFSQRVVLDHKGRGGSISFQKIDDNDERATLNWYCSGVGLVHLGQKIAEVN